MRKYLLSFLTFLLPLVMNAEVVEIDGIYYDLIPKVQLAEVTKGRYTGSINIPESVIYEGKEWRVTSIASSAFANCYDLISVNIGSGVTSIGSSAFAYCSGLISVNIGRGVSSIGFGAFYGCSSLKKVIVPDIAEWCEISFSNKEANPLYYAGHLYSNEETEITDLFIPNGVSNISAVAFYGCTSLTSVNISDSVKTIGSSAFSHCSGLISVNIGSGVTSIESSAFYYCHSLNSAYIGSGVISIGPNAFAYCSALSSVNIPSSLTNIGDNAFKDCSGLKKIIVSDIASWCRISFSSYIQNPLFYAGHLYSNEETEITDLIIPKDVDSISDYAFYNCRSLSSVKIPSSVKNIGAGAFNGCFGLIKIIVSDIAAWCRILFNDLSANPLYYAKHLYSNEETEITDLIIPKDVASISKYAFSNCCGLSSVDIPNSVTSIGDASFCGCSGLSSINIPNSVTCIGPGAFADCSGLSFVDIPNSVTSIGSGAFSNCLSLSSINIPNSVTTIDDEAFECCLSLATVNIPNSVNRIGKRAFQGCEGLVSVNFGSGVTSIGSRAFEGCIGLTSVNIPNSVTSISSRVFGGCIGLAFVNIPNSVTSINASAFLGCSGLSSINIPNSVTSIGESVFKGCDNLSSVNIGIGVTSIGQYAFANCPEITDVFCYAETVPTTNSDAFENSYINYATLHVPTMSIESYRKSLPWKNFKTIEKINTFIYTITYMVDGEVYKTFQLEEGATIIPEEEPTKEGYIFSGWSVIPETMPAYDVVISGTFSPINPNRQCETPTISYVNGKLKFECKTEDAEFVTTITDEDIKTHTGDEVTLSATYTINVIAKAEGYKDSEVATAILCWIDTEPCAEGTKETEDNVTEVKAMPIIIQRKGNTLSVSGAPIRASICVYDLSGRLIATTTSNDGSETCIILPNPNKILMVGIGEKYVKIGK